MFIHTAAHSTGDAEQPTKPWCKVSQAGTTTKGDKSIRPHRNSAAEPNTGIQKTRQKRNKSRFPVIEGKGKGK